MKKITEKDIENAILDYLTLLPGTFWKNNTTGIYDPAKKSFRRVGKFHRNGVADILGVMGDGSGRFVAIEVKTMTGKLSDNQKKFLDDINANNGIAFVARSVDDVREKLVGQSSS